MQAFQRKFTFLLVFVLILAAAACTNGVDNEAEGNPAGSVIITIAPTPTEVTAVPLPSSTAPIDTPVSESAVETVDFVRGGQSIGDLYAPELGNTGYDVQHYTIALNLDPQKEDYVAGSVTIEAVATEDNLGELSLDFIGFDINELTVNGQTAVFTRNDAKLIITLPEPAAAGETFEISVSYAGNIVREPSPFAGFASSLGMFFGAENTIYVLSEPDGSRYWFPNNDHPRDKATYRFEVTVPAGYTAVANGLFRGEENNTFIWEHDHQMASYLATIAIAENYERLEDSSPAGIPLRHYAFPEEISAFERSSNMTGEAIDWMGELFGTYPYETYGYVTVHAPGVSLETQTIVLLSTGMLDEQTVIHELAHMWFGDWVSLDSWGEMWRNEGFATYLSFMWEFRDDPEGLELAMEGIRASLGEADDYPTLKNPRPENLFSGFIYVGGAVMAHDLRQEMGDEAFFSGLKNYFQKYGGGVASDEQFIAEMEAAAGKDLSQFFELWLD